MYIEVCGKGMYQVALITDELSTLELHTDVVNYYGWATVTCGYYIFNDIYIIAYREA